ncbi:MAG TPA: response regulator [Gemmataceae bacterium]|nr:response regulator [Gemmataceae bacterium]
MSDKPMSILLAEDDDGQACLIMRNLKRAGVVNEIIHVKNGQQALDCIRYEGAFAGRPHNGPLLVILDINMPHFNGVEVLRRIKSDSKAAKIPVVILTTTDDPREVQPYHDLGYSAFVTKPVAYTAFVEALRKLGFYLQVIKLASESD